MHGPAATRRLAQAQHLACRARRAWAISLKYRTKRDARERLRRAAAPQSNRPSGRPPNLLSTPPQLVCDGRPADDVDLGPLPAALGNSSHELVENTRGAIRDRAPPPRTRRRSHVHMAESRERGARPVQAKLFDAASSSGWGPNRTRITSAVPTVTLSVRSTRWLLPPPFFFRRVLCEGVRSLAD